MRPNVGRYVYALKQWGDKSDLFFLTSWEDPQLPGSGESRTRANVEYVDGGFWPVRIVGADGTELVLGWGSTNLESVSVGRDGSTEIAVRYALTQTTSALNLSATYGADGGGGVRVTNYNAANGWFSGMNGNQLAWHPYSGTLADYGQGNVEMYRKGSSSGGTFNWTQYVPTAGQTYRSPRSLSYTLSSSTTDQPVVTAITEDCFQNECYSSASRSMAYATVQGYTRLTSASNARGAFSVNSWDAGQSLPTGAYRPELVLRLEGATNAYGSNPLVSTQYTYSYGSSGATPRDWTQYVAQERRASVLGAGDAVTLTQRDPQTNRITATMRTGWTKEFNTSTKTWSNVEKVVATFYFTNRKCGDEVADPFGRTLEIHGPCYVSSTSATDCPGGGSVFPVTQFGYFAGGTANPLNAHRLEYVKKWTAVNSPTDCTGTSLATSFGSYDLWGNPGTETDANGVVTTLTYENHRVKTRTVDSKTTSFIYDLGKLTAIQHPEGNYDVFCYRAAELGSACSQALDPTEKVQWQAKSPNADGTSFTEGIAFTYLADGRLSKQEFWDGVRDEKRRQLTFEENARGENIRTTLGTGEAAFSVLRRYDADGNLTAFNSAVRATGCGDQAHAYGGGSSTCANLKLDGIGRVVSMDVPGASSDTGRTCIAYDGHGNVSAVKMGCPSDANSYPGPDCSSCTQPVSSYETDDFGNVVSMTLPHLGTSSEGGTTRVAFSAEGYPLFRQTPTMVAAEGYHAFTYDALGRPLGAVNYGASAETLFSFTYDDAAALSGSCPQPSNTMGRLLRRTDTFGDTWYQYSPEGRILGEVRLRNGTTSCSSQLPRNVPHTFYTYTNNGSLASIQCNRPTNGVWSRVSGRV